MKGNKTPDAIREKEKQYLKGVFPHKSVTLFFNLFIIFIPLKYMKGGMTYGWKYWACYSRGNSDINLNHYYFFLSILIYNAVINLFSEPEQKKDIAFITKNEKQFLESYRKLSPVQQKSILKDIVICK